MKFNDYQQTGAIDGTEMILVRKWNPAKGTSGSFDTFKTFVSTITQGMASTILSQIESLSSQFANYASSTNTSIQNINSAISALSADEVDTTTPTVLKLTGTLATPTIQIGRTSVVVPVTGVQMGDAISVTFGAALPNGATVAFWRVTAVDKITVDLSASLLVSSATSIPITVLVVR